VTVGDFNIHVDDTSNAKTRKFLDIMADHEFVQHVQTATHQCGHVLDPILTRSDVHVSVSKVDPPLLSDHAFIVAHLGRVLTNKSSCVVKVRLLCALDVEAFARNVLQTDLIRVPPKDVQTAFSCYDLTLRSLPDQRVPVVHKRERHRVNARWFDNQCRAAKRDTRRLERCYRRLRLSGALSVWHRQFQAQRSLYQTKFTTFWQ
jgi:hypothetical protein